VGHFENITASLSENCGESVATFPVAALNQAPTKSGNFYREFPLSFSF
jgi:hypothetical protein